MDLSYFEKWEAFGFSSDLGHSIQLISFLFSCLLFDSIMSMVILFVLIIMFN